MLQRTACFKLGVCVAFKSALGPVRVCALRAPLFRLEVKWHHSTALKDHVRLLQLRLRSVVRLHLAGDLGSAGPYIAGAADRCAVAINGSDARP